MTEYVILIDTAQGWQVDATRWEAWSPEAAIRSYAVRTSADDATVYVAIPARAWKPMRVSVKSEVRVTVEAEA